jgi:hypothetical protein
MTFQKGNRHGRKYRPGESGNPSGQPRSRIEFERAFYDALISNGSPEEAAGLLWEAARDHQPWAVLGLLQRLAPETQRLQVGVDSTDGLDFSRLTEEEFAYVSRIIERLASTEAAADAGLLTDGKESA